MWRELAHDYNVAFSAFGDDRFRIRKQVLRYAGAVIGGFMFEVGVNSRNHSHAAHLVGRGSDGAPNSNHQGCVGFGLSDAGILVPGDVEMGKPVVRKRDGRFDPNMLHGTACDLAVE